jgi:hypothetical protein
MTGTLTSWRMRIGFEHVCTSDSCGPHCAAGWSKLRTGILIEFSRLQQAMSR